MAEILKLPKSTTRKDIYESILPQIEAITTIETDVIANLANIAAILKEALDFFWVGFYLNKEKELVLGPFQGSLACTRISFGKGVCGACYTQEKTIIVPDVEKFPGHIACSTESKSEIVVPIVKDNSVKLVLDIDSDKLNDFSDIDKKYLEKLARIIIKFL